MSKTVGKSRLCFLPSELLKALGRYMVGDLADVASGIAAIKEWGSALYNKNEEDETKPLSF